MFMARKFTTSHILAVVAALGAVSIVFLQGSGIFDLQSSYASGNTIVTVNPFFQFPGRSVLVTAEGLAPNANATIYAKNVIAKVETQKAGEPTKTVTFPDIVVVGTTETNQVGTVEWALGVPKDEVKVIERWINNSTGQEEVLKTVTTIYSFQGTVRIIVADEYGNSADAELTIIKWIVRSPFN